MHISKRSNGIYYLWYDEAGLKRKVSTGTTVKSDALRFLQHFSQELQQKKTTLRKISISNFVIEYLDYSACHHTRKTCESARSALREFLRIVRDRPLHKISMIEVQNFLSIKRQESSIWTVARCYRTLSAAFEVARKWNCILENPFKLIPRPRTPEAQPVFVSVAELQKMLGVIIDRTYKVLVQIGFHTGLRLGELRYLQWSDIDFVRKAILVRNSDLFTTKNKKERIVPLNNTAFGILTERHSKEQNSTLFVFHDGSGNAFSESYISHNFKKCVRKTGLNPKLHFHSLRHSFASNLVQNGVSLYEVQHFLGHSTSTVTQKYAHLQPLLLHNSVNKLDVLMN